MDYRVAAVSGGMTAVGDVLRLIHAAQHHEYRPGADGLCAATVPPNWDPCGLTRAEHVLAAQHLNPSARPAGHREHPRSRPGAVIQPGSREPGAHDAPGHAPAHARGRAGGPGGRLRKTRRPRGRPRTVQRSLSRAAREFAAPRRAIGETQATVAARLACSARSVRRWETGESPVPPLTLQALRGVQKKIKLTTKLGGAQ